MYILTPGHKRRHLDLLADGILGHTDSNVALYMIKKIITIKPNSCVSDTLNCGQAYATICLTIKVTYNPPPGHIRLRLV